MFVAIVLVCVQAIVQDTHDCTVGTAIQSIEIEQFFFSEEECMNRGALVGRAMFLHEIKPDDEVKVICEHRRNDNH